MPEISRETFERNLDGLTDEQKSFFVSVFDEYQNQRTLKKTAFQERDDLKTKLKTKDEEYTGIKTSLEAEVNRLKPFETEINEYKPYKEKYEAVETERRTELLQKLPEGELRETADLIKDINVLTKHVTAILKTIGEKVTTDDGASGRKNTVQVGNRTKLMEFSLAEQKLLKEQNPTFYDKLVKESKKQKFQL